LKRFATGTFLVWHPFLPTLDANQLPEKLKKAGAAHWLHATLSVRAPATQGHGMHGSGMFVINPPWTLAAELEATLPCIAQALALDERATWHIEQLEQKSGKSSGQA
jgi:23S rRNA (adenine2030-N6)-methyltransferase